MSDFEITAEQALEWQARERQRFQDGTYVRPPWADEPWVGLFPDVDADHPHFVHVSADDPNSIAYTPSHRHGVQDRQVRVRPGRYLNRYYGNVLCDATIRHWVLKMDSSLDDLELRFARTEDEIVDVYRRGPGTCMTYAVDQYCTGGILPVAAYAGGDLSVAYMERDDRVAARAVVWEEKRVWERAFGDDLRMRMLLEREGFRQEPGGLEGARISARELGPDVYMAPYVDGACEYVRLSDDHLILTSRRSPHCVRTTNGSTRFDAFSCARCSVVFPGEEVDYHHMSVRNDTRRICGSCVDKIARTHFACPNCNTWRSRRRRPGRCTRCDEYVAPPGSADAPPEQESFPRASTRSPVIDDADTQAALSTHLTTFNTSYVTTTTCWSSMYLTS